MSAVAVTRMVLAALLTGLGLAADPWWTNAFIYQIYPVSFKDSDGDGYGDLRGIIDKLDYLKELGVEALWLSPIYRSPNYDWGYDISDFREIDPLYGTMADFEDLLKHVRRLGMYLIMDFVPNHTSDQHPWFLKSVRREEPYTDYYVWRDARGTDAQGRPIPPNNWVDRASIDSCWQWHPDRKQFYLHQYLVQQPDLNFRNPKVAAEITDLLRFWLDKGVDGLRVDSVPFLFEDEGFRDEVVTDGQGGRLAWWDIDHVHTQNLQDTYDYLLTWGTIVEDYIRKDGRKRVLFLEVYASLEQTMSYYMGPSVDGDPQFMIPFNFEIVRYINRTSEAADYKRIIDGWMSRVPSGGVSSWVLGNHDNSRVATNLGPEFSDAINMLANILPGVRFLYNGEELAMEDAFVTFEQAKDNFGKFNGPELYLREGRDPERTPMQWDDSLSAGFSTNSLTWLPVHPNYWTVNVAAQQAADRSHLKVIQEVARLRNTPTLRRGSTAVNVLGRSVLVISRVLKGHDSYTLVVNVGSHETPVILSEVGVRPMSSARVLVASLNSKVRPGVTVWTSNCTLALRPKSAVLLEVRSQDGCLGVSTMEGDWSALEYGV